MNKTMLTCIGCPMGCALDVSVSDGQIVAVSGNLCGRGKRYAQDEITHPLRMLTTTVQVEGGKTVAVKTSAQVPKESMFDCISALREVAVQAPIHTGDVLVENLAGTGADLIAAGAVL